MSTTRRRDNLEVYAARALWYCITCIFAKWKCFLFCQLSFCNWWWPASTGGASVVRTRTPCPANTPGCASAGAHLDHEELAPPPDLRVCKEHGRLRVTVAVRVGDIQKWRHANSGQFLPLPFHHALSRISKPLQFCNNQASFITQCCMLLLVTQQPTQRRCSFRNIVWRSNLPNEALDSPCWLDAAAHANCSRNGTILISSATCEQRSAYCTFQIQI